MDNRELTSKVIDRYSQRERDAALREVLGALGHSAFTGEALNMIAVRLGQARRRQERYAAASRAHYAANEHASAS